jgi:hypothetical protein
MRRLYRVLLLFILPMAPAVGQSFFATIERADSLEKAGKFTAAMQAYERAYGLSGFDPTGLGLAARSAARGGLRDAALRDLSRAIDQGYLEPRLLADSAFKSLRADPRWKALEARLQRKLAALNQSLRAELIKLAEQDQLNRKDFGAIMQKYGPKSPQGDSAIKVMNVADAAIQSRVQAIIIERGWPTRSMVADDGAHSAWLVVQHMPKEYQAAVLPKLLAAVKAGEAQPGDGALLQDRVLAREKKPQIYGSQLSVAPTGGPPTIDPIENEACVDMRRKSVGLEPLAEYVKRFGIIYKAPGICAAGKP